MNSHNEVIWGIDFGSNLSGTTVICTWNGAELTMIQSAKKQSADDMILKEMESQEPDLIMIDAPLSLPPALLGSEKTGGDYFFRHCDKSLKAMSPMFLGGLTARAIRISHLAQKAGIKILETYPAAQARRMALLNYKKAPPDEIARQVCLENKFPSISAMDNAHQLDALLALVAGLRYKKGIAIQYGEPSEGVIYI